MFEGEITMSHKELKRLEIIQKVEEKRLSQREAGEVLGCTSRTIRLLLMRYHHDGPAGLVSKRRGKPSNRTFPASLKQQTTGLIRDKYPDFGPTLATEKLAERDNIFLSRETTRKWMIEKEIWTPKIKKTKKSHPPRERRANYGELIQIDGSPHDWFEGRSSECCLIVFVDDATSRIQWLHFAPAETTFAYFDTMERYAERYGLPVAAYSDRHSIFRVNHKQPENSTGLTQFGRAMMGIGVKLIHANSPQAKGKVENRNKTLQDRLIKEMRLDGIDNRAMANGAYLEKFMERFNAKFAKVPRNPEDFHQTVDLEKLKLHFTLQAQRKVSKNLTISYKNKTLVIEAPGRARQLYQAKVIVCEDQASNLTVLYKGQSLSFKVYNKSQYYSEPIARTELATVIPKKSIRRYLPPPDHPWRLFDALRNKRKNNNVKSKVA
jgi:hypothetical protein